MDCAKADPAVVQVSGMPSYVEQMMLDKLEKNKKGVKVSGKNAKGEDVSFEAEMLLVADATFLLVKFRQ